MQLNNREAV
jgi:hypothetical protein